MSTQSGHFSGIPSQGRLGDGALLRDHNAIRRMLYNLQAADRYLKSRTAATRAWAEYMPHVVKAIGEEYLQCVRLWRGVTEGTEVIYVRRPDRLLMTETDRDGVTFTPGGGGPVHQSRIADNVSEQEVQVVTPVYLLDDVIIATPSRFKYPATGTPAIDQQRRPLVDSNVDGRVWARDQALTDVLP